jgi:hypothetical protein
MRPAPVAPMLSSMRITLSAFAFVAACAGTPAPARPVTAAPPAPVEAAPPTASACAAMLCLTDTRCEETHGQGRCVPIMHPANGFCGGIAGLRCPAGQRCVDAPGDGCDPARGGRDCGGVCVAADAGVR